MAGGQGVQREPEVGDDVADGVEDGVAVGVDLDTLRDVIADLGLPLHRLTTRLTSLDEVFLDRAGSAS